MRSLGILVLSRHGDSPRTFRTPVGLRTEACYFPFALAVIVSKAPSALDHTFSARDLFRRGLVVWIWSILSVLLLVLLLLTAGLFIGILADRGRIATDMSPADADRFRQITGLPAGSPAAAPDQKSLEGNEIPDSNPEVAPKKPASATVYVGYDEEGILPAVWRARDSWWGPGLAWLFRNVDLLRSNILGCMSLLIFGALLVALRVGCLSQLRWSTQRIALEAVAPLRRNVHRQALRLGPEDLDGTGLVTAREVFVTEIEQVRHAIARWIEIDVRFPLELLCLALVVVSLQHILAAQFLLFLGAAWYYLETQERRAESERKQAAELAAAELRQQAQSFQSARLIRGLGIEQMDHDQFALHLVKYHDLSMRQIKAGEYVRRLKTRDVAALAAIAAFLLFVLATHILLRQNELSIAGGSVFVAAWLLALPGANAFRSRPGILLHARAAADKVQTYLDQIPSVSQAVGAKFLNPLSRGFHFDSVTYRTRAGKVILKDLDLSLESGRTYSLISLDPLESTALVSMLPRFIEPQSGRILFDGEDIAWATLESLRAETVFVGADEQLLPGTVLDNIRGGRPEFTLQQATDAAKLSHAHNFIVKMFDGYESDLPERADLMDVSQRFRLALARAMIRNPALLIIEEPKVSLDEDTKALLADAYERICRNRTVIFLPGRLSTVRRCDQVIVVNEGRIAAMGPQSKLVNISPIYRHWEYLNFNEFRHQVDE